jgi:hypothetical protein
MGRAFPPASLWQALGWFFLVEFSALRVYIKLIESNKTPNL